ncbi:MAG: hypothetical protein MRQ13_03135 [Candidatus Midichloria sp.]|nr:hypothetical protein [Candidatus Midichloria sp.]
MAGNNPLKKQLEQVKEYIKKYKAVKARYTNSPIKIIFFSPFQRRHWTMLELDVPDQANNNIHDSKG